MPIRIALPKGRLLKETAQLTEAAGWQLSDYSENARLYHLKSGRFTDLAAKILHEKDIPVQVALGNYDLGICGLDWIQELVSKYPASGLVKIKDLGYGRIYLYLAAGSGARYSDVASIQTSSDMISVASEYPNLAESLALNLRLKRFNIFPVWGAAEIYPPENADLVLLSNAGGTENLPANLIAVGQVLTSTAFLIANKNSLEIKDLSEILDTLIPLGGSPARRSGSAGPLDRQTEPLRFTVPIEYKTPEPARSLRNTLEMQFGRARTAAAKETSAGTPASLTGSDEDIRLALPDGHAQKHVVNVLAKAGIRIKDYPSETGSRTPEIAMAGFKVKVIRPQDMPLQVANGKFDIAITGRDWVREHIYQFPASPIIELVDLKYSKVKIVVAVHNGLPIDDIGGLRDLAIAGGQRLRIASEYTRIADKYARDNHLGMYRIIPTWGATEAFLPDDADLLIENTETGSTLIRHNLKIIETLFESTACLIGNRESLGSSKAERIRFFAETLVKAVD